MKNLILILSFLLTFAANAEEMTENRLFGYYKNSTSCAVAYNLQFKIAAVSNTIDMGLNSARLLERIGPMTSAWVTISMRLENELQKKYNWSDKRVSDYRSSIFTNTAETIGLNLWHTNIAKDFVEHLFGSTVKCNALAIEIREVFKDTLDDSIQHTPKPIEPKTRVPSKPKKKM